MYREELTNAIYWRLYEGPIQMPAWGTPTTPGLGDIIAQELGATVIYGPDGRLEAIQLRKGVHPIALTEATQLWAEELGVDEHRLRAALVSYHADAAEAFAQLIGGEPDSSTQPLSVLDVLGGVILFLVLAVSMFM